MVLFWRETELKKIEKHIQKGFQHSQERNLVEERNQNETSHRAKLRIASLCWCQTAQISRRPWIQAPLLRSFRKDFNTFSTAKREIWWKKGIKRRPPTEPCISFPMFTLVRDYAIVINLPNQKIL